MSELKEKNIRYLKDQQKYYKQRLAFFDKTGECTPNMISYCENHLSDIERKLSELEAEG